jgi:hypothetical protein
VVPECSVHLWTTESLRGKLVRMNLILAFNHHTGIRLAEIGFLLVVIGGIWLTSAQIPQLKFGPARTIVAGLALALGGVLLIIATHWGHFG